MTCAPRITLLAVMSLAAACKEEDVAPPDEPAIDAGPLGGRKLSCDDADLLVSASLATERTLVALRGCSVDSDCTVQTAPVFRCDDEPQVRLTRCDLPIGVGHVDASVQFVSSLQRLLCPRIARPCRGEESCVPARPLCVEGECKMVSTLTDAGV